MIHCRMLGAVEITVDGAAAPPELLWRKHLALLVYLVRAGHRPVARDHLLGLLWPDKPEPQARHSLNEALRVLRRAVGDEGLDTDSAQVRLLDGVATTDLALFESHAGGERWREAAALVGGLFCEGLAVRGASGFEDWLEAERGAWTRRSSQALLARGDELLTAGALKEAQDLARFALSLEPLSEAALRLGMRAAAIGGERVQALARVEEFAARVKRAVGAEISAETRALAERIGRERVWRAAEAPDADTSRRLPLVGRAAEMARLLAVWSECRSQGRAGLALLTGEVGAGKTRLLEELLARARLDGAVLAAVRVVQADEAEPEATLLGLARGGLAAAAGVAGAPSGALATFAARLTEWQERFPGATGGPMPVTAALEEVLRAAAVESPVVLAIDDAQWADRASLLGVEALLRGLAKAPVLVVLAAATFPARDELDGLRARIPRDLPGAVVSLAPLGTEALRDLARHVMPGYGDHESDRLARRLAVDSAGLPLLAVELLHAVANGLDLQGIEGAWPEPMRTLSQTLPGDLPDAVVGAIRVGFRRLSPAAQQVLAVTAILGDRVPEAAIARAAGLEPSAVAVALDELEWHRWLAAEPRGYSFVARIVQEVVRRDMVTRGQRQRVEALGLGEKPA